MNGIGWRDLLFDFRGRISRSRWWAGFVLVVIVAGVNGSLNRALARADGITTLGPALVQIATFVIGIAILWPALAVSVKRWHDRDKSGWWMLIGLVPLIGQIWVIVELGLLTGTAGPNRYGDDPRDDAPPSPGFPP